MLETAFEKFVRALESHGCRHYGKNWSCPAHEDDQPSLSVNSGPNGMALFNCFAACDWKDILSALDLTPADIRVEVERYPYRDAHGDVLNKKIRFSDKKFQYEHSQNGTRLPLYNLPEVIAAIRDGWRVWVVEGEKDANRLTSMGEVATTNPNGASEWHQEYTDALTGADVVIVADKDEPGVKHARLIERELRQSAKSVRVVQSLTSNKGADISDHLDAKLFLEDLVPLDRPHNSNIASKYSPVNWTEAFKRQPEDVDWLFPPILETGTTNALFGKPGVGKSLITLEIAMTLVREGKKVMYLDDENRVMDTVDRLKSFGCKHDELAGLVMYSFAGLPPLDTPDGGEHLAALADLNDPALIILDTTTRMVEGDENSANTFLQLYRCSLVPLKKRGITVLRLDHPGKDDRQGQRGSSAKDGDVDSVWRLAHESDDMLVLERLKSRSGHGEGFISVKRLTDPLLAHDWQALDKMPVTPQIMEWAARFNRWGVPRDSGRPTLRASMKEHNVDVDDRKSGVSTTMLALIAKHRKAQAAQDKKRSAGQSEIASVSAGTENTTGVNWWDR